jgi:hypothetical protein
LAQSLDNIALGTGNNHKKILALEFATNVFVCNIGIVRVCPRKFSVAPSLHSNRHISYYSRSRRCHIDNEPINFSEQPGTTKWTELISKGNIPPDMDLDFLVYDHASTSKILETSLN